MRKVSVRNVPVARDVLFTTSQVKGERFKQVSRTAAQQRGIILSRVLVCAPEAGLYLPEFEDEGCGICVTEAGPVSRLGVEARGRRGGAA
eukprot:4686266-Karenia_brevis.AAC.1